MVWQPVNDEEVKKHTESEDFIHKSKCGCGVPIHTFRIPGESVEGYISPCRTQDRMDRQETAELEYITASGGRAKVAIRLSGMIRKAIAGNHLWGQWVKITYVGSKRSKFPNSLKIYSVDVFRGSTKEGVPTDARASKNRPAREQRSINRPVKTTAAV